MRHERHHPSHGVRFTANRAPIVFLTVCTKGRRSWLANEETHQSLRTIWLAATAWRVGAYVLMPDHLHLFATPAPDTVLPLDNWVRYWKSQWSKAYGDVERRWQTDHWDRRLRSPQDYAERLEYMRLNPVRADLVSDFAAWPFQGEIHPLAW